MARAAFHQCFEVGLAVAVAHDNLSIDDGRSRRRAQQTVADCGEASSVVVAIAGEDHHLIAGLVQLRTPAVEFDLVKPAATARRSGLQNRCGRRDETGFLWHAVDVGAEAETINGG